MLCHGELFRLRPAPRYLTSYYLMIAAGGPVGGVFVALIAPTLFSSYVEWKLGIVGGFVLAGVITFALAGRPSAGGSPHGGRNSSGTLRLGGHRGGAGGAGRNRATDARRRIVDAADPGTSPQFLRRAGRGRRTMRNVRPSTPHVLFHGLTNHGMQLVNRRPAANAHRLLHPRERNRPGVALLRPAGRRFASALSAREPEPWPFIFAGRGRRCASTKSIPRCRGWPKNTSPIWPTPATVERRSSWCWEMPD